MRVTVRVRPGASRTAVGGCHGERVDGVLVVAVTARAVDGAATAAVLRAVADAFDVRPRAVSLHRGATSRTKTLDVDLPDTVARARLERLLRA